MADTVEELKDKLTRARKDFMDLCEQISSERNSGGCPKGVDGCGGGAAMYGGGRVAAEARSKARDWL